MLEKQDDLFQLSFQKSINLIKKHRDFDLHFFDFSTETLFLSVRFQHKYFQLNVKIELIFRNRMEIEFYIYSKYII